MLSLMQDVSLGTQVRSQSPRGIQSVRVVSTKVQHTAGEDLSLLLNHSSISQDKSPKSFVLPPLNRRSISPAQIRSQSPQPQTSSSSSPSSHSSSVLTATKPQQQSKFSSTPILINKRKPMNQTATTNSNKSMELQQQQPQPVQTSKTGNIQVNIDLIRSVTNLSGLIYILGRDANPLLAIVEQREIRDHSTLENIQQMKSKEFLASQSSRFSTAKRLLNTFFIDVLMKDYPLNHVCREIAQILEFELTLISSYHHKYIENQERNLATVNQFQDKEVKIIADFHAGLAVLIKTYNVYFKELEEIGARKPEQAANVRSLFLFKSLLRIDRRNEEICQLFQDLEELLKSNFEKIEAGSIHISKLVFENAELTKKCRELQEERAILSQRNSELESLTKNNNIIINQPTQGTEQNARTTAHSNMKAMSDYYESAISSATEENRRLNETIVKLQRKIQFFESSGVATTTISSSQFNSSSTTQPTTTNSTSVAQNQSTSNTSSKAIVETSTQSATVQDELNRLKQEEAKNKVKAYYSQDKQTQCSFIVELSSLNSKKQGDLCNIVLCPLLYIKSATQQPKEWVVMVTNALFADKLLADVIDENEGRQSIAFHLYICEWFLKKFGDKEIAETLLKDFLISLEKFAKQNERFKLVCEMAGMDDLVQASSGNQAGIVYSYQVGTGVSKEKFKKEYLRNCESQRIYLTIAYLVRMTKLNYYGKNAVLPVLPNILQKCLDLVPKEFAAKVWQFILSDLQISNSDFDSRFKRALQQDLIQRQHDPLGVYGSAGLAHSTSLTSSVTHPQELECIRFDSLARAILEHVLDSRFVVLETIYTGLKLKSALRAESAIPLMDFSQVLSKVMPQSRTTRSIEIVFREFISGVISERTPLNVSILKIVPYLCNFQKNSIDRLRHAYDIVFETQLKLQQQQLIQKQLEHQKQLEQQRLLLEQQRLQQSQKKESIDATNKGEDATAGLTRRQRNSTANKYRSSIMGSISQSPMRMSIMNASQVVASGKSNRVSNGSIFSAAALAQSSTATANVAHSVGSASGAATQPSEKKDPVVEFKEKISLLPDPISSLGLLEESYKLMFPLIKQIEKKNVPMKSTHAALKESFDTLPGLIVQQIKYDSFHSSTSDQISHTIEDSWEKFRSILAQITRRD